MLRGGGGRDRLAQVEIDLARFAARPTCPGRCAIKQLGLSLEASMMMGRKGVSTEERRNESTGETEDPRQKKKKTRPVSSPGTIPTCENPEVARPGIEPGSLWWKASSLTAQPPQLLKPHYFHLDTSTVTLISIRISGTIILLSSSSPILANGLSGVFANAVVSPFCGIHGYKPPQTERLARCPGPRRPQLRNILMYWPSVTWPSFSPVFGRKNVYHRLFTIKSLDFRKWEPCRTMPLIGGFSRRSPVSPALSFRRRSIFTLIPLIGSKDLAVKSRPNLFTHPRHTRDVFSKLERAPPTEAIRARLPAGSLSEIRMWKSCRNDAVGWWVFSGVSRIPALTSRRCSIFISRHPNWLSRPETSDIKHVPRASRNQSDSRQPTLDEPLRHFVMYFVTDTNTAGIPSAMGTGDSPPQTRF
ncbi:hypothetical protein PR048_024887 [Dryococelus australis]|uniref:Uncharacterized protein n=1 Tax=Dryococelus australis TaxID=614101 RepID=A0ABQ9GPT3_9NEOP|nr:hypothetical protein PR048_024887 [Dryococelus australis]